MSQKLTFQIDGPAVPLFVILNNPIKLVKLIDKLRFPAKDRFETVPAVELSGHGFPSLIDENLFCDKSNMKAFGPVS